MKCLFQLSGYSGTIDYRVNLKVQRKASDIHICSTHTGHLPIYAQTLGVQESIVISIAFGSRFYHLPEIRVRCPVYKWMIRLTRDHNPHIYTRFSCNLKRIQDIRIRYKIWCLNTDTFLRQMDQMQVIIAYLLAVRVRSTGYDLHRLPAVAFKVRCLKQAVVQEKIL